MQFRSRHGATLFRRRRLTPSFLIAPVVGAVLLSACGADKGPATKAAPAPVVGVVTLKAQEVPITTDLPGRTVAYRVAQIRPQVSGIILKRSFVEGSDVKAGQPLYQIDPAPYQAKLDAARAQLLSARAALTAAQLKAQRYRPLAEAKAVSQLDLADAVAVAQEDEANVASSKAALETAKINLRYTRMLSPIAGRIGRSTVTAGALVTADQSDILTTVQQIDPIYVDVSQPSSTLLRLEHEYADGQLKKAGPQQARVSLTLDDGSHYPQTGKLQFSEVTVDQSTGSVTLRAVFPNPDHLLLPGMFVHMQINEGISQDAVLVPQQGVTHNTSGQATALVVNAHDQVESRIVRTREAVGNLWLVNKGLKPGDRVIVSGLQDVKPGQKVRPQPSSLQSEEKAETTSDQPASAGSAG